MEKVSCVVSFAEKQCLIVQERKAFVDLESQVMPPNNEQGRLTGQETQLRYSQLHNATPREPKARFMYHGPDGSCADNPTQPVEKGPKRHLSLPASHSQM